MANPLAAILSGAMLLRYSLGLDEEEIFEQEHDVFGAVDWGVEPSVYDYDNTDSL